MFICYYNRETGNLTIQKYAVAALLKYDPNGNLFLQAVNTFAESGIFIAEN